MDRFDWAMPVSQNEAYRRAGGRRSYNSMRAFRAEDRRSQVVRLLRYAGLMHGAQTWIARRLGVSRSTICRDFARLFHTAKQDPCETPLVAERRRRARRENTKLFKEWGL
jgi:hypothetical protein